MSITNNYACRLILSFSYLLPRQLIGSVTSLKNLISVCWLVVFFGWSFGCRSILGSFPYGVLQLYGRVGALFSILMRNRHPVQCKPTTSQNSFFSRSLISHNFKPNCSCCVKNAKRKIKMHNMHFCCCCPCMYVNAHVIMPI